MLVGRQGEGKRWMTSLDGYLGESAAVIEATRAAIGQAVVDGVVEAMVRALRRELPVLVCGNGGSAADAQHITAELVGRFLKERRALPVICLADNAPVLTAWANDHAYDEVFARQVEAYGRPGSALIGISTSGNSANVVAALAAARVRGVTTIALTGAGGGRMAALADHLMAVPSERTPLIQQVHICLYHYLCERVEAALT
jgi:D-sedoheptulose 7-phosphate isomerase